MGTLPQSLNFYAPIEKTDDELHMVYGYASTEAIDSQGEIVKKSALTAALADYMKFANIREMHQPSAVGKAKHAKMDPKGMYISAKVVDQNAWNKVKEGVYSGFSIGGRVEQMVDNEITALKLSEISLVDRPANPEAVFDVFKADLPEIAAVVTEVVETTKRDFNEKQRKTMADKGQALPDGSFPIANESDLHNAIRLYGRAKNKAEAKAHIISRAKAMGMTSALPDDWDVKADTIEDLAKDATAPVDGVSAVEGQTTPPSAPSPTAIAVPPITEPTDGPNPDAGGTEVSVTDTSVSVSTVEQELEPVATPAEDIPPVPDDQAVPNEVVQPQPEVMSAVEEADQPVDIRKTIETKITQGLMPTDGELTDLCKAEDIEPSERNLGVMKFSLAGKIIDHIAATMKGNAEADLAKKELEKVQTDHPLPTAKEPHQFDDVKFLVRKLEKQMEKSKASEIPMPQASLVSPKAHNETVSEALKMLQQAVAMLSGENEGKALTESEEDALANGVTAGSTITGGGHYNEANEHTSSAAAIGGAGQADTKAEETGSLAKLDAEITALKAEVLKLAGMPEPVKIKTSYTVIEKFDTTRTDELAKAEARSVELQEKMHKGIQTRAEEEEANKLSLTIMRLRRAA